MSMRHLRLSVERVQREMEILDFNVSQVKAAAHLRGGAHLLKLTIDRLVEDIRAIGEPETKESEARNT